MCNILTHTHTYFWLYPVKNEHKNFEWKKGNNELNTDRAEKNNNKERSPNKLEPQQRRCKIKYHIYSRPVWCYYYRILTKMPQITHAKRNEFNQFHHDYFTQNVQTASLSPLSRWNWKRTDTYTNTRPLSWVAARALPIGLHVVFDLRILNNNSYNARDKKKNLHLSHK